MEGVSSDLSAGSPTTPFSVFWRKARGAHSSGLLFTSRDGQACNNCHGLKRIGKIIGKIGGMMPDVAMAQIF